MILLDGLELKSEIQKKLLEKVHSIPADRKKPTLVIIQVGDRPESNVYVRQKIGFGEKIGVNVNHIKLSESITETELIVFVHDACIDQNVHGLIVQLPLPSHIKKDNVMNAISPEKDVDGLTPVNFKKLCSGDKTGIVPATARGIDSVLAKYNVDLQGKHVVIVGRSMLVGKPTFALMLERGATATICHSKTVNLEKYTKDADVLITAVGKPMLIKKEHVKEGQIVVDVGISVTEEQGERHIKGDVDFENVKDVVDMITPVPGGIGPLTVACLFENLIDAYHNQIVL
ncbi:bifunctional 5,10-methylenetetrahydrofolate dehydrogenase/5,10-methenyltetrahydrofolate cyclohydrolase [bacterium]|nr:bifunctional 5,10-methylenetetrahydrofolate dehydrogenase/5,10-methenyltetrahydrofolate cyclohydrolase [bacterium]